MLAEGELDQEDLEKIEEIKLACRCKEDPSAFIPLYNKYLTQVFRYCCVRIRDEDGEDLTSEIFMSAFKALSEGKFQDQGKSFSCWLFRIAHNAAVNYHRDESRRSKKYFRLDNVSPLKLIYRAENPEEVAIKNEEKKALIEAVGKLSDRQKEVIYLKFPCNFSNQEIAEIMGTTEGAARALLHRSLVRLRKKLQSSK